MVSCQSSTKAHISHVTLGEKILCTPSSVCLNVKSQCWWSCKNMLVFESETICPWLITLLGINLHQKNHTTHIFSPYICSVHTFSGSHHWSEQYSRFPSKNVTWDTFNWQYYPVFLVKTHCKSNLRFLKATIWQIVKHPISVQSSKFKTKQGRILEKRRE